MKKQIFQSPDELFFHNSRYRCVLRIVFPAFLGVRVNSCQPKSYAVLPKTAISPTITASLTENSANNSVEFLRSPSLAAALERVGWPSDISIMFSSPKTESSWSTSPQLYA